MPAKKKGHGGVIFLVILLVAALGVVGYFGFREGGWFRRDNSSIIDATKMESMLDYAHRLEAAGNPEAAAAVYELIPQSGGADLLGKAAESIPLIGAMQDMDWLTALFGDSSGGSSSKDQAAQQKDALTDLFGKLKGGK